MWNHRSIWYTVLLCISFWHPYLPITYRERQLGSFTERNVCWRLRLKQRQLWSFGVSWKVFNPYIFTEIVLFKDFYKDWFSWNQSFLWDLKILQASLSPSWSLLLRKSRMMYNLGTLWKWYTEVVLGRLQYCIHAIAFICYCIYLWR